ncbi:hypothetical protein [Nostoc sp.]|uniref:hypothetical protein n=1 Tax=Nostoc sp. TaxID=1180 RepID=UPI002FFA46AF
MHLNANILAEIGAIASVGIMNTIPCFEWRLQKSVGAVRTTLGDAPRSLLPRRGTASSVTIVDIALIHATE